MKRFTSYLKLLLVAVGLLAGSNASAADEVFGTTSDAYLGAHSTPVTMKDGGTLHYTFSQVTAGAANHQGFIVVAEDQAENKLVALRGDNWEVVAWSNEGITSDYDWTDFPGMMNGASVDMTVTFKDGVFAVEATIKGSDSNEYHYAYSKTLSASTIVVYLSEEASEITISETTYEEEAASDDSTSLYERGTTNAWSDADLTDWVASYCTPTIDGGILVSTSNAGWTCTKAVTTTENSIVTLNATLKTGGASGRSGSYDYVQIGGVKVCFNEQDKKAFVEVDGVSTNLSLTYTRAAAYNIQIVINQATGEVSYKVNGVSGTSSSPTAVSEVVFGHNKAGRENYAITAVLQTVEVTEVVQSVTTADYTIKYVCDGEEVKATVVRTGVVGTDIALLDSDKENFYVNDKKYIYDGDGSEVSGMTVLEDGSAVVEVPFREAEVYAWTANSNYGSFTVSGTAFEGDKVYVSYPLYVLDGGKLYTKVATNKEFKQAFDITEDNMALDLVYADADVDAIFYTEAEDVAGMTVNNSGNANVRSSQSAVGYTTGRVVFTTLPVGKYKIVGSFYSPTSAGGTALVYAGNRLIVDKKCDNANATAFESEFVLAKESNNIAFGAGGANAAFDYVYIQQLEDPTDEELTAAAEADKAADFVNVTLTDAGWATLFTDKALDFSGSGLKAYTATCDGATVTLTEVATVPANTGVVLKGEEGNYDVAVAAASATEKGDLQGSATETTAYDAFDGYELYALAMNGDEAQFCQVASGEIPAGKAFLKVAEETEVSALRIVFGETDGIEALTNAENETSNAMFDLSGRRVLKAQKGIYVKNGKKVIF